jgi:hypothetical protein
VLKISVQRTSLLADWLLVATLTLAVFIQRYYVLSSDPLLAWPITDSIAHPNRYSPQDILIQAGTSGNFLLYKLLGFLPVLNGNFPLRDFLIYLPIYFLTLLAWVKVFREIGATQLIVAIALLVLVCSDDKLSLNWAHVAPAYFISATSVQFLQVLGLLWFLKNQRVLALGITAATGYLHPASALTFGAVYCAIIAYDAMRNRSWKELAPVILFACIFLPNALLIASNSQGAFLANKDYFLLFESYQPQAYLEDHFRFGYAYTLALIAFLYRCHTDTNTWLIHKRELFLFIGIGLLGCAVWLINLYFVRNLQFIQTFFLMRMFSLIHPLVVVLTVATAASLYSAANSYRDRALLLLLALTPMLFSPAIALIIVSACVAYTMGKSWWPYLFGMLALAYLGALALALDVSPTNLRGFVVGAVLSFRADNSFNGFQVGVLALAMALTFLYTPKPLPGGQPKSILLFCVAILFVATLLGGRHAWIRLKQSDFRLSAVFNFNPEDYWGVRQSDRAYAELLDWARLSPDRLFSVPPYDDRFLSFRFLSGKGVFIFHRDIAQLMYSPDYYIKAVQRLVEVGGNAPYLPKAFMNGEMRRDNGKYEENCRKLLVNNKYDAVIFERARLSLVQCEYQTPVFQNDVYVVFRTGAQNGQSHY